MTDLSIFVDNQVEDRAAMNDFLLANSLSHSQIAGAMQQRGMAVSSFPLTDMSNIKNWLSDHAKVHANEFFQTGLVGLPNLEDVDLEDQQQYHDWQELHSATHAAVNVALGLI